MMRLESICTRQLAAFAGDGSRGLPLETHFQHNICHQDNQQPQEMDE
jgi:hypothetical protein